MGGVQVTMGGVQMGMKTVEQLSIFTICLHYVHVSVARLCKHMSIELCNE